MVEQLFTARSKKSANGKERRELLFIARTENREERQKQRETLDGDLRQRPPEAGQKQRRETEN